MTGLTRRRALEQSELEHPRPSTPRRPNWSVVLGWLVPIVALALGLVAWEVIVRLRDTPTWFIPKPTEIGREMIESRALIWRHTWTTLQEMLIGLALAFVLGVLLAVLIASSRLIEMALYP